MNDTLPQIGKEYWIEGDLLSGPPMIARTVNSIGNRTTWRLRDGRTLRRSFVSPPLTAVEDDPDGKKALVLLGRDPGGNWTLRTNEMIRLTLLLSRLTTEDLCDVRKFVE